MTRRLLSIAALLVACSSNVVEEPASNRVTFYRDVEPILQVKCGNCHRDGGIGRLVFDDKRAPALAAMIVDQTSRGLMPPWPPGPLSKPIRGERRLTQGELDTLAAWKNAGAPLGDIRHHVVREPVRTFAPIRAADAEVFLPEPYSPNKALEDDVRCFVIDLPFKENVWIEAVEWVAGTDSGVHHIGGGAALPGEAAAARKLDADEKDADGINRPGYACPGGLRVGLAAGFGAAGGHSDGVEMPKGTGIFVPTGSSLIMTVHYWTPGVPAPDRSGLRLWAAKERNNRPVFPVNFVAPTALPCPGGVSTDPANPCSREYAIAHVDGFTPAITRAIGDYHLKRCNTTLDGLHARAMPSADGKQMMLSTDCTETLPFDASIVMMNTHMHTRGRAARLEVSGSTLLDIPRFDWHWEGTYSLETPVDVSAGSPVKLSCTFDNGTEAQPIPAGASTPMAPRYVVSGEGRFDEMCGGNLYIAPKPFQAKSWPSLCDEAKAKYDAACPGKEAVSTAAFKSGAGCTGDNERLAVLLQMSPPKVISRLWCNPEPKGAVAEAGDTCRTTLECAATCKGDITCVNACTAKASAQAKWQFDRLIECTSEWCKAAPEWGACAAVACKGELTTCFK